MGLKTVAELVLKVELFNRPATAQRQTNHTYDLSRVACRS